MISIEILILAIALSMDAFAVTISNSCAYPHATSRQRLAMPVVFGVFQGLMPLIGYYAVSLASDFVELYAGVIAFAILGIIGGKMVFNGVKAVLAARKPGAHTQPPCPTLSTYPTPPSCPTLSTYPTPPPCPTHDIKPKTLSMRMLLLQGIATSIDALLCGVSLLALGANIFVASPIIAITTFACCLAALFIGKRVGVLLGEKAEIVGGVVLILIGVKALF